MSSRTLLESAAEILRRIDLSAFLEEFPPVGFSLRALASRPLHFTPTSRLRPAPEHLAWHPRHHGFAS